MLKKGSQSKKKGSRKGSLKEGCFPKITRVELEVLELLTKEFLSAKRISIRRKTSLRNTNKIIKKLKDKGVINSSLKKVPNFQPTQKKDHMIRLHGQEFNIKIIFKDDRYSDIINKCNMITIDGNTIRLYKNSIEVYSNKSFYGDDADKATYKSLDYFNRLFIKLENDLNVILIKPRSQNIKLVNSHYSEMNNELSEECNKNKDKIKIYAKDDGKLWFTIDNSFNLNEAETLHPITSKPDMDNVKKHFNDMRDNDPPTITELLSVIKTMAEQNKETATGLNAITHLIKSKYDDPIIKEDKLKQKPFYVG